MIVFFPFIPASPHPLDLPPFVLISIHPLLFHVDCPQIFRKTFCLSPAISPKYEKMTSHGMNSNNRKGKEEEDMRGRKEMSFKATFTLHKALSFSPLDVFSKEENDKRQKIAPINGSEYKRVSKRWGGDVSGGWGPWLLSEERKMRWKKREWKSSDYPPMIHHV